ncbi:cytochrome c oxidase subunit 3 [Methylocystis sp. IM3]|uniref:cytochrome c oxidase subunit 3 n=1 Tax=Methylocystis sp. IM3 TaxID=3136722 RepID=UPI000FA744E6|nr:MAG: cytochrome c oxidase subunit 3 family protein [Hyphomicrobiales bacterium]
MIDGATVLRFPWPSVERQRLGVAFGMWTFLASEILFFGGLFLSYAVYRSLYPQAFAVASHATSMFYGTINTALLLTSSFVMTLALHASKKRARALVVSCLLLTAAFGLAFLAVKGLEYAEDIDKGLIPGPGFTLEPDTTRLFFALYWVMTGIHAIHLAIGVALVVYLGAALLSERMATESPAVEATSLYWHFVDSIWLVLYALIYLPGRHAP